MKQSPTFKKLEYLWIFSGLTYAITMILLIVFYIPQIFKSMIEAVPSQSALWVFAMGMIVLTPFFAAIAFTAFSMIAWYLLKNTKPESVKKSNIFSFLSLIIFGFILVIFLFNRIVYSYPFGIGSILGILFLILIILFDIAIIILSFKIKSANLIK